MLQFLRLNATRLDELQSVGILDHILKEFDSRDAQQKGGGGSKAAAGSGGSGSGGISSDSKALIPPEGIRVTATAAGSVSGAGVLPADAVLLDGTEDVLLAGSLAANDVDDSGGGLGAAPSSSDGAAKGGGWGREEASRYWSDLGGVIIFCRSLFQVGGGGFRIGFRAAGRLAEGGRGGESSYEVMD